MIDRTLKLIFFPLFLLAVTCGWIYYFVSGDWRIDQQRKQAEGK